MTKLTRLACSFEPPSISVECVTEGAVRYLQFPVVFGSFSDPNALFDRLTGDYPEYFGFKAISPLKLRTFVQRIVREAPSIDLDHVSKEDLLQFKRQMDVEFDRNAVKPGDPEFQYDLQVDFGGSEPCDWDD
jgi:hypothetical protein